MEKYQTNSTKEELERWYGALRSGEYKQGTQNLCNLDEEFCCLGVYHDVNGDEDWEIDSQRQFGDISENCWSAGPIQFNEINSTDFLSLSVMPKQIQGFLSQLNDTEKYTFEQIADWCEPRLLPKR